ncbi:MAG: DUF3089 domain-containing protein [Cyclobacteriaceae bacterium]
MKVFFVFLSGILAAACSSGPYVLKTTFDEHKVPSPPDYASLESWAAHPDKKDAADSVPFKSGLKDEQATAAADVFFIYPTIFTGKPEGSSDWNADVRDPVLSKAIQTSTILNQASIFNGAGKVYAPSYRQAHYHAFLTPDREMAKKAFAIAYQDVRNAFNYYLTNFNQGRPIIIASHSQGSLHAEMLLKEFFDGKPLQSKLIAAYLVGRAIPKNTFSSIPASEDPARPGVWASWCTFLTGYFPGNYENWYKGALTINPLTWTSGETPAAKELNHGGVGFKYTFVPALADARALDGILWINKPYVTGRFWVRTKNWHRADMNLFWMNIRENSLLRTETYLKNQTASSR